MKYYDDNNEENENSNEDFEFTFDFTNKYMKPIQRVEDNTEGLTEIELAKLPLYMRQLRTLEDALFQLAHRDRADVKFDPTSATVEFSYGRTIKYLISYNPLTKKLISIEYIFNYLTNNYDTSFNPLAIAHGVYYYNHATEEKKEIKKEELQSCTQWD